ncbi:hypothetical protein FKM82_029506 [Ascaphus truei]
MGEENSHRSLCGGHRRLAGHVVLVTECKHRSTNKPRASPPLQQGDRLRGIRTAKQSPAGTQPGRAGDEQKVREKAGR